MIEFSYCPMTKEPGGIPHYVAAAAQHKQFGCMDNFVNEKTDILPNFIFKGNEIEYGGRIFDKNYVIETIKRNYFRFGIGHIPSLSERHFAPTYYVMKAMNITIPFLIWFKTTTVLKPQNKNVFQNDYDGNWKIRSLCEFIKIKGWKRIGIQYDDGFDNTKQKVQFLIDN